MSRLAIAGGIALTVAAATAIALWPERGDPTEGLEDLYIRSYDGLSISATLRRPRGKGPFPAILVLHGDVGGNYFETLHNFIRQPFSEHFYQQGYVVMAADYRRYHFGEDELQDVVFAFQRLQALYYVDPERVSVAGGSHGGYLALMLATVEQPAAVVSMAGLVDIEDLYFDVAQRFRETFSTREEWFEQLLGNGDARGRNDRDADRAAVRREQAETYRESGSPLPRPGTITYELALELAGKAEDDRELYQRLSPLARVEQISSPVLYVVGAKDLACLAGKRLIEELRKRGVEAEYAEYKGMRHSFYWGIGEQSPQYFDSLARITAFLASHRSAPGTTPPRRRREGSDPSRVAGD